MEKMQKIKKHSNASQVPATELMPHDADSQHILHMRAQFLATSKIKQDDLETSADGIKYICFNLGNAQERYGLPYQFVKEVINNVRPTKLPTAPNHIAGVINRRGNLIAVIDLKHFFHTKLPECEKDAYIIVITVNDMTVGILADGIEGSNIYDPTKLDPPFTFLDIIKPDFIIGLHQGVTAIINVEVLMSSPELQVKK
jgi:purine-binding chemotaxis protein CheW